MLYTFTIILITVIALLMVVVVLLQSGQGQGLSGGIGGGGGLAGGSANTMGARRTADFLSKSTTVLAAMFLSLCLLANFFIDQDTREASTIQEQSFPTQGIPEESAPALPDEQQQQQLPQEDAADQAEEMPAPLPEQ